MQSTATTAFSAPFWPFLGGINPRERQRRQSTASLRFRAIFAAQEHFIFRATFCANLQRDLDFRTVLPLSRHLEPPTVQRAQIATASASRIFSLASQAVLRFALLRRFLLNRAEPPFLRHRTSRRLHIRQSADLFRHLSPNQRLSKNNKRVKRHCQQKLAFVHAPTRFLGEMAASLAAAKLLPMRKQAGLP